jgi:hypothetical protein
MQKHWERRSLQASREAAVPLRVGQYTFSGISGVWADSFASFALSIVAHFSISDEGICEDHSSWVIYGWGKSEQLWYLRRQRAGYLHPV